MIVITEQELAELQRRASEPDARLKDLIDANKEAERYAGRMETALERIATVCRLARHAEIDATEFVCVLDLIQGLSMVKDDRRSIGKYGPNEQG